jgi:proline racemase
MRAARSIAAVDSHTEGMPTRVVVGGVAPIPGASMLERKLHFEAEMDDLRLLLMREPRGHGAMSGAILQPPARDDADWGVLFIEVSGCLPMCGHGTIGVATVLVETGMVAVSEPETVVRLDTPAGLVEARVAVDGGRARSVTLRNVPSFLHARDAEVDVPGLGRLRYDMAFGGNFYALLPAADAGLEVDPAQSRALIERGREIMAAINAADRPVHPEDARIAGCRHVIFHAPGRDGADARAATSIHPGWLDRSPCGTGTSARLAQLHARGELAVGDRFVNESVIGTRFTGRVAEETTVGGRPAIVPEITGRAWITAMGQYLLDAEDPFPAGFAL